MEMILSIVSLCISITVAFIKIRFNRGRFYIHDIVLGNGIKCLKLIGDDIYDVEISARDIEVWTNNKHILYEQKNNIPFISNLSEIYFRTTENSEFYIKYKNRNGFLAFKQYYKNGKLFSRKIIII